MIFINNKRAMVKKETTKKKTTKKATSKKTTPKKVIEEVANSIIESQEAEMNLVEQEYLDAIAENMAAEAFIENKELEYEPTEEQIEKTIEFMNGDPSVIIPSNDIELKKADEIEEAAFKETFKSVKLENNRNSRIDRSFGYSWNGVEIDY